MQYSIAALAFAAAVQAYPQAAPAAPSDCSSSYDGTFEITVVNTTESKRSVEKRAALVLTLADGILKDADSRIGYIAANHQFQFDNPVQTGTIYASGWAVCPDGTLVLGTDSVFQQCLSGTFYNLYDQSEGNQCNAVKIYVLGASSGTAASQSSDGQPVQSQQSDGQVTGTPAPSAPVTQITDGQPQAPTGVVTQITDGQIQAPTGVVTQITDGQIQAPTGAPVTQITDGQIQAPTGAPVTQISDGQIQAPTNGTVSSASPTVQPYTGAAAMPTIVRSELFGLAAGVLAVAML